MDVAHIPLSLRHDPPIGYFSYFSNAHSISRATGGEYIPHLDKVSVRDGRNIDMIEEVSWLTQQEIGLSVDTSTEKSVLQELQDTGGLTESRTRVSSCFYRNPQCGKTEYQGVDSHNMEFVASKHRLDIDGLCSLCNHKLEVREEDVLLLKISQNDDKNITVQTPYLKKNIDELFNNFEDQNLMISRLRKTGLQWGGYNIDNDFSNYLSLYAATSGERKRLLYLASANTSMAVMGMIAVSKSLKSVTKASIVALPKLSFVDRDGSLSNITMSYLRESGISRAAINLVLLLSMGASSQNLTLESREFGLMQRRLSSSALVAAITENSAKFDSVEPLEGFYRIPNKQDIYRTLKELSAANRPLSIDKQNILAVKAIGSIVCDFGS